jgi:hypothetical protein
MDGEDY